jgi:hypothetical protein
LHRPSARQISPANPLFRYAIEALNSFKRLGGSNHRVPLSSAKRAWIAVGVLLFLTAGGIGVYLHLAGRKASKASSDAGPSIYSAPPEQMKRTLGLLNELPPEAAGIGYIDVESLRKLQTSPLAALLGLTGSNATEDRQYQQFVRETGFDYTRDLDRAAIAFWFESLDSKTQNASADNRVFVVADGRFDERKIRAYALKSGRVRPGGARPIYEVPGKPDIAFEFLSPTRIAIASGIHSAELLRDPRPDRPVPGFPSQIDRVAGAPLFGVVRTDRLPESFYANLNTAPQIETLARSLRSLTLAAQPQGDVLQVALDGESDSPKNALAIATVLEISRMGASIALSNSKSSSQLSHEQATFIDALLRRSKITHQDRWVRLAIEVTPDMLGSGAMPSPVRKKSESNPTK